MQRFAALVILPVTTAGWVVLLCCAWLLFPSTRRLLTFMVCPTAVFCTSWLLWHHYQPSGWRRNVDMAVAATAIFAQTYLLCVECACGYHSAAYWSAFATGWGCYFLGYWVTCPKRGIIWHAFAHVFGYTANVVLFRCVGDIAS